MKKYLKKELFALISITLAIFLFAYLISFVFTITLDAAVLYVLVGMVANIIYIIHKIEMNDTRR